MSQEEHNQAHAKKLAARADGTAKVQTYPANRAAGRAAEISDAYQAKLEARIAAFNAGKGDSGKAEAPAAPAAEKHVVKEMKGHSGKV